MKLIMLLTATLFITACAGNGLSSQELALVQAQMQAQTLTIDCPAGCSVQYKDPRDTVQIPRRSNGWDALIAVGQSTERLVAGAVPVAGMGYLGVEALKAMKGHGTITTITTDSSRYVGDYSGDGSGATTTTIDNSVGDYSGQMSGNDGTIQPGNSGRIGSNDDYTSEPTVVLPPDPVFVEP